LVGEAWELDQAIKSAAVTLEKKKTGHLSLRNFLQKEDGRTKSGGSHYDEKDLEGRKKRLVNPAV